MPSASGTTTAPLHLTCGGIPAPGALYRPLRTLVSVLMCSIRDRRSPQSNYWRTGRPRTDAQAFTGSSSRLRCESINLSLPVCPLMLSPAVYVSVYSQVCKDSLLVGRGVYVLPHSLSFAPFAIVVGLGLENMLYAESTTGNSFAFVRILVCVWCGHVSCQKANALIRSLRRRCGFSQLRSQGGTRARLRPSSCARSVRCVLSLRCE